MRTKQPPESCTCRCRPPFVDCLNLKILSIKTENKCAHVVTEKRNVELEMQGGGRRGRERAWLKRNKWVGHVFAPR